MKSRKRKGGGGRRDRPLMVGEQIREALSEMLHEGVVKDPRVARASILTVTGVDMSPDLRVARAYVSVFPDDRDVMKDVLLGLGSAVNELRRSLAERTGLRLTPELSFHYDGSIAEGARIEALLREVVPPLPAGSSPEADERAATARDQDEAHAEEHARSHRAGHVLGGGDAPSEGQAHAEAVDRVDRRDRSS